MAINELDLKSCPPGTLVRSKLTGTVYIVTANYGGRLTAVKTVDVMNPSEWETLDNGCSRNEQA